MTKAFLRNVASVLGLNIGVNHIKATIESATYFRLFDLLEKWEREQRLVSENQIISMDPQTDSNRVKLHETLSKALSILSDRFFFIRQCVNFTNEPLQGKANLDMPAIFSSPPDEPLLYDKFVNTRNLRKKRSPPTPSSNTSPIFSPPPQKINASTFLAPKPSLESLQKRAGLGLDTVDSPFWRLVVADPLAYEFFPSGFVNASMVFDLPLLPRQIQGRLVLRSYALLDVPSLLPTHEYPMVGLELNGQSVDMSGSLRHQKIKHCRDDYLDITDAIHKICQDGRVRLCITNKMPTYKKSFLMFVSHMEKIPIESLLENVPHQSLAQVRDWWKLRLAGVDDEVSVSTETISLRDSYTLGRIQIATRSKFCNHPTCFDLKNFLTMNQTRPTWHCPLCDAKADYGDLFVDDYMMDILDRYKTDSDLDFLLLNKDGTLHKQASNTTVEILEDAAVSTNNEIIEID
jgi:hypothetical protein